MTAPGRSRTVKVGARRAPDPGTVVLILHGTIAPRDIPAVCRRAWALLEGRPAHQVVCDVAGVVRPDAATVDALARLKLLARALGGALRVEGAAPDLHGLIELMGLSEVLPCDGSAVEARRQTE